MDHVRFDALTRALATGTTRRRVMQVFSGTTAAVFVADLRVRNRAGATVAAQGGAEATAGPGVGCANDIACEPGHVFSEESCSCICDVRCPPNFAPDPSNCNCYCTLSDSYQCLRPDQVYDNCACVCANDDCPGDAILDPDSCLCYCPENIACPAGESPDPTTCECECTLTCEQPGFVLDEENCECICNVQACSGPYVFDLDAFACVCPPGLACPVNQQLDPETCTCECSLEITCRPDQIVDPRTCECGCPSSTGVCHNVCVPLCLPTQAYDVDCQCEDIVCPPDRVLICSFACPPGTAECKESCMPACGPHRVFDDACRCVCVLNISCAAGRVVDAKTCDCVCAVDTCPDSKTFDETTCKCNCPPNIKCPKGEALDKKSCDCACRPGKLLDTIKVPCDGSAVSSSFSLRQGVHYTLRASGWCSSDSAPPDAIKTDAEYAFSPQDPIDFILPIDRCGIQISLGIGIDDPLVDTTREPFWGSYTTTHVYSIGFTGKGAPINVNLHDCIYSGTKGTLKVEIFCT